MTDNGSAGPGTTSARYEADAREWDRTGREPPALDPWSVLKLGLWMSSDGAKHDGVSETLGAYSAAARRALDAHSPEWFDAVLMMRDVCSICDTRYRVENLSLCTMCGALLCYAHRTAGGVARNGNLLCPVCRTGEIVG